jgi:1-acyl-sn-glycerol-3-phosphate acyltransferase
VSAWLQLRGALVRATGGESKSMLRVGLPAMPRPWWPWYYVCVLACRWYFRLGAQLEVIGLENLPKDGGWMFASNHISSADPAILTGILLPHWVRYMAKVELFQKPGMGELFALSGTFPVRRFDRDLGALREAEDLLAAGRIVGMFPEGHRSDTGAMIEAHPGTALIALRSNAPVVPVAITGSEAFRKGPFSALNQPKMRVVFGQPFQFHHEGRTRRADVEAASERIMREIAARLPARYRGVYLERFRDLPATATIDPPAQGSTSESRAQ